MKTTRLLTLSGAALFAAQCALAAVEYTVVQLSPDSSVNNGANAIHANGFITGRSSDRAFLRAGGVVSDLGLVPGFASASAGYGVNASGQVAGYAWGAGGTVAARYSNGSWTNLGTLGGTSASAYGINDAGHIVGYSRLASGQYRGFLHKDGVMHELAPLAGDTSYAYAINASDQIAGTTTYSGGSQARHAAIYTGTPGVDGQWTDIGSLGGSHAAAYAINAHGHAAGASTLASGMATYAFLYANGVMKNLGSLPNSSAGSEAYGINDSGTVVGVAYKEDLAKRAFVYRDGLLRDLNLLIDPASGWQITEARAVDNADRIVGDGVRNGTTHAILLEPIAPKVSVAGKKKISTRKARVVLRGTATGALTSVSCKIGRTSYPANGTERWKVRLKLKPGRNVVRVTATGPAGSDTCRVVAVRK